MSYAWVQVESNSISEDEREWLLKFLSTCGKEALGVSFILDGSDLASEADDVDGDFISLDSFSGKGTEGKFYFTRDNSCYVLGSADVGSLRQINGKVDLSNPKFLEENPVLLTETCISSGFRGGELDNHLASIFLWKGISYFDCSPSYCDYIYEYNENPQEFKGKYKIPPFFDEHHLSTKELKVEVIPEGAFDDLEGVTEVFCEMGFNTNTAHQIAGVLCGESCLDVKLSGGYEEQILSSRKIDEILDFIKELALFLQSTRSSCNAPASISFFLGSERNIVFHISSDGTNPHTIIYDRGDTDEMAEHYMRHISELL